MPHRPIDQPELLQYIERKPPMPKLTTGHAAVLDRIQTGDRLFGKDSERFIANRIGVDQVIPKSINDSIDKLRKVGPVIRVKRGE